MEMRRNYIREKKILCGDSYMAVRLYAITPQERKARGKKRKESSADQKSRNKMSSLRKKQRKAIANFDKNGFFLTGTFEEAFLPEDILDCKREVVNYKRRVIAATCKRFGVSRDKIRMMLWAVRKGEAGRLHMHGFVQCVGMGQSDRREFREMLEDLWRRRIPSSNEYEPLGTMNADRIDMKKLLGNDGTTQGKHGTIGYIYGHKERICVESKNLELPVEQVPNDNKWSRKQLRTACSDMQNDAYWWGMRFPGWTLEKCVVYDPEELHQSEQTREDGWEVTEPQCYVILSRKGK